MRHRAGLLGGCLAIGVIAAVRAQAPAETGAVNAGTVSAAAPREGVVPGASAAPSPQQIFRSGETTRVLDKAQIRSVGPVAGAAQALSLAPGANVTGYGNTGSSKYTISLDGLSNGWGGAGGYGGNALLQATLDGIPMNNLSTGRYPSASVPQLGMIQSTAITYGPGEALGRWFDSGGGTIDFVPIQPTVQPGGHLTFAYGSYDQKNVSFDLRTGLHDGWSTVLAGGAGSGNSFRVGPDGFDNPNHNYVFYGKTIKTFGRGDVSFGAYFGKGVAYRPNVIPLRPVPNITINGFAPDGQVIPGPLYSQANSFYQALPVNKWSKYNKEDWWDVYSRQNLRLTDSTVLHNLLWFSNEARIKEKVYNFQQASPQQYERLNSTNHAIGDKIWITQALPYNTIDAGGYFIRSFYNTKAGFWNPSAPYFGSQFQPNGAYRSGQFYQDDAALFVQDDIHPIPAWHITPGLRLVTFDVRYVNAAVGPNPQFAGATGTNQSAFGPQHNTYAGVEPSISTNYQLTKWLALYGSYAETYVTPSVGGGGGLYQAVPATDTRLELARDWQAGFKVHLDAPRLFLHNLSLGANYFDLRFSRQVLTATLFGGAEEVALGTSEFRGVNFYLDANPLPTVHTFLNASLEQAVYAAYNSGGLDFTGRHVPYVPNVTINWGVDHKMLLGDIVVTPRFWLQFVGRQTYFDDAAAITANGPVGAPSRSAIPAYETLNLAVDALVPFTVDHRQRTLDLSLSVLNLLDKRYNAFEYGSAGGYFSNGSPVVLGYPGTPLTVYGQLALGF